PLRDYYYGPDAGAAYVFDLDSATPGAPALEIPEQAGYPRDEFGTSVAIDGNYLVVGAPKEDTGAVNAGSAYVFDLSSSTPAVPVLTIHNPAPNTNDYFGASVGISGNHVVVGAYQNNSGATHSGSAYVYDLASATPAVPVVTWNNPAPGADDWFGLTLAISDSWVVVGAPDDDTGAEDAGSAYLFNL